MKPAYGNTRTRILLAVIGQSRPTVKSVAEEVGRSVARTHYHLCRLEAENLVAWDGAGPARSGAPGTLRALVQEIPL